LRIHDSHRHSWRAAFKQFMASGAVLNALALFVVVGILLLTLSRSAAAGLGVASVVAWLLGRRRLQDERTSVPAALAIAGTLIVGAMLFVDIDAWTTRLQESMFFDPAGFGRLTIWRETLPIVRDFWLTGSGGGTYSDVMGQYQQSRVWVGSMQRWAHFNNAHSHYLQLAAEGGLMLVIPVLTALIALAALGIRAVRADKGEMFWVRVGAAASLAGIAVQSIWEVALIMPANTVLCAVLAGLLLNRRN
jgi:O-antigen ligase